MAIPPTNIPTLFTKLGVHRVREHLSDIRALGETMTANAPFGTPPCCAWDSGNITRVSASPCSSSLPRLLLDLGGTHTKVAKISPKGTWRLLFDRDNSWFETRRDPKLSSIEAFFHLIAREIRHDVGTDTRVRIGVIWSNQIATKYFHTTTTRGVTGIVTGLESGGYRKGEWFLRDLKNGDDLGALLLKALQEEELIPEVLIIGNDTLFTLYATPGAHAGVVMSSGGNCTLLGTDSHNKDQLFNSELGGMLSIPHDALSEGDRAILAQRQGSSLALEELCAGNWFAESVVAHLRVASTFPEGAMLLPLLLGDVEIHNHSLSSFIARDENPFAHFPFEIQELLRGITTALIERASLLAGLLTHLSVIDQAKAGAGKLVVSLDSSMARYFPGYLEGLLRGVDLLRPSNVEVLVKLVCPINLAEGVEISVPLQGLARVIENY